MLGIPLRPTRSFKYGLNWSVFNPLITAVFTLLPVLILTVLFSCCQNYQMYFVYKTYKIICKIV